MAAAIIPVMEYAGLAAGAYSVYQGISNNNLGEAVLGAVSIYLGGSALGMWNSSDSIVNGVAADQAGANAGTATADASAQQVAANADQAALSEAGLSSGQGAGNLAGGIDASQAATNALTGTTIDSGAIPSYNLAASQAADQGAAIGSSIGSTAQDVAAASGTGPFGTGSSVAPMSAGATNGVGETTLPTVPNYNLGSTLPASTGSTPLGATTPASATATSNSGGFINNMMKNPLTQYGMVQAGAGALQGAFTPNAEDVAKYNQQLQQQNLQWLQSFYSPNYQVGGIPLPTPSGKTLTNSAGNPVFPTTSPMTQTGRGLIAGAAAKSAVPQTIPVRQ